MAPPWGPAEHGAGGHSAGERELRINPLLGVASMPRADAPNSELAPRRSPQKGDGAWGLLAPALAHRQPPARDGRLPRPSVAAGSPATLPGGSSGQVPPFVVAPRDAATYCGVHDGEKAPMEPEEEEWERRKQ